MGRIYTIQFNNVAVTAQQDLFEIVAPSDGVIQLHEIGLGQSTEIGDAEEEMFSLLLKSGATTSGSGGTSPAAVPLLLGDAATGATTEVNNTTKATTGTIVTHYPWAWNVRVPFQIIWTPETRPVLAPSRRLTMELATTPVDSVTLNGYIVFEEIG